MNNKPTLNMIAVEMLKSIGMGIVVERQKSIDEGSVFRSACEPEKKQKRRQKRNGKKLKALEREHLVSHLSEINHLNQQSIEDGFIASRTASNIGVSDIRWGEHFLTKEQAYALQCSKFGDWLKVEAFAGSGKTTLLNVISTLALTDKKVLYIAFNRAIVDEANRVFPSNVTAKTTHSLAGRDIVDWSAKGKKTPAKGKFSGSRIRSNVSGSLLCDLFDVSEVEPLSDIGMANYALEIITRFCNTADEAIGYEHTSSEIFDSIDDRKIRRKIKRAGQALAIKIWEEMSDIEGNVPITHDVYLKVWALTNPSLEHYDVILFDEAQDANPLILDVVEQQKTQNIFVGDRYQQIYSWRGAVNAMSEIDTKRTAEISQSFRFGVQIADLATKILSYAYDKEIVIRGFESIKSVITYKPDHGLPSAIICRTNALLISELLNVIENHGSKKVAIEGGIKPLLALLKGARDLKRGKRTNVPELATFKTWSEVKEFSETAIGGGLKTLVKLVAERDLDDLIETLESSNSVSDTSKADVVLTTAHKSKGKEYRSVRLGDDFRKITRGCCSEEANLLYVALTRATHKLDVSNCTAIGRVLNPEIYENEDDI